MKDLFVIQNISPFYPSHQDDSRYLTDKMEKYRGINCTITFKKVIDPSKMIVDDSTDYKMHFGNTNPKALKCLEEYVTGIKTVHTDKNGISRDFMFLASEKIVKNAIIEFSYVTKIESGKTHIVPKDVARFVKHANKVKKTDDKITQLF